MSVRKQLNSLKSIYILSKDDVLMQDECFKMQLTVLKKNSDQ